MKCNMIKKMGMMACVTALTMTMAMPVYAADISNTEEIDWDTAAVTNVTTAANLRQAPGMDAKVQTTLPRGTVAVVEGTKGDWTKVVVDEQEGYIYSELLAFGEEAKKIAEEPAEEASVSVSATDAELDLLAAIIQCEAGGESHEGKVAVGAVIMNRVASGQFPNSISEVVYQSGQFSPVASGILQSTLAQGAREDCYQAAREALAGSNPIGACLYFNSGYGQGIQIGNQHFF